MNSPVRVYADAEKGLAVPEEAELVDEEFFPRKRISSPPARAASQSEVDKLCFTRGLGQRQLVKFNRRCDGKWVVRTIMDAPASPRAAKPRLTAPPRCGRDRHSMKELKHRNAAVLVLLTHVGRSQKCNDLDA